MSRSVRCLLMIHHDDARSVSRGLAGPGRTELLASSRRSPCGEHSWGIWSVFGKAQFLSVCVKVSQMT